jgi:hypothetical protein
VNPSRKDLYSIEYKRLTRFNGDKMRAFYELIFVESFMRFHRFFFMVPLPTHADSTLLHLKGALVLFYLKARNNTND